MTKADRIRKLLAAGCTAKEIAQHIGCMPEYVRAVKKRTAPTQKSRAQRMRDLWKSPEFRQAQLEATRRAWRTYRRQVSKVGHG